MSTRWLAAVALLVLLADLRAADKPELELFGRDRVWTVHLTFTDKDWEAMQPSGRPGFPGFGGPPPAPSKDDKKDAKTSVFGQTFPYVKGNVEFEGKTWKDVGLRFKGNSTYLTSARGLKRPLKLDFNHYDPKQRFHGHTTLNLNNNILDVSHQRQALGFALFREAGVPAPRTAFAQVYLSVPGKHNKEYLGLYTLIEEVNKSFLKRHFDSSKGLLLKPERIQGLPHLGDDWKAYTNYQAKTDVRPQDAKRVIDFTRLLDRADDDTFKKEVGNYLEVDQFLRFLAVNVLLSNIDSFMGLGHNYYVYVHPKTGKLHFMPWDLDLSLGGFSMVANQENLSVREPYLNRNRLIERLFAIKEYDKLYREHLRKLTETAFSKQRMGEEIEALNKVVAKPLEKEPKPAPNGFPAMGPPSSRDLKPFVEKRLESVVAQLNGKSDGVKPSFGFGGMGQQPMPINPRQVIELADTDKDGKVSEEELVAAVRRHYKDADKNKDGVLDERELNELLQKAFPRRNPFGGAPGGGPGARPRPEMR